MQFDAERHVGAVIRAVEDTEYEGRKARAVVASRHFDTRVEDLWEALTSAERLPRWFSPVTGELRLGGRYQVQGNAGGTITRCDPPRALALTWEFGGQTSWVEVALREAGADGSELVLRHIAPVGPEFDGFWNQFGPGAVGVGWDLGLLGLALHVEQGWDKPPETDTTFHTKPEGRAYIIGSSEGWERASLAYGTDAKAARKAGAATSAFYTGEQPPEG